MENISENIVPVETTIWISEFTFNNGTSISFSKNDIVVFVGPNNAGKSASLKDASTLLRAAHNKTKVVTKIQIEKEGNIEELLLFLSRNSRKSFEGNPLATYSGYGYGIYETQVTQYWNAYNKGLAALSAVFSNTLTTTDRLTSVNPALNIKLVTEAPAHPIHFLQKNDSLEKQFSEYFKQAFGKDLIVHRNAGSEVPLYVGDNPKLQDGEDRLSERYLSEIEKLDLLHEQGDGMKSFVSVLLNSFVSNHSILFIDEPEAFLHPPQAKLLGKMLAKNLPSRRQLFMATHSEDFLKGLLDANAKNLKIIRIQRNGVVNDVNVLNSSDISDIWNDSLLRHSNVLDGLFHSKVIICESDSDSRFYSAVLTAQYDDTANVSPDYLFVDSGGKQRLHVPVIALKKINVPVHVISDFDIINSEDTLKRVFESLGGNWSEISQDWNVVNKAITGKPSELSTKNVKREIEDILASVKESSFPTSKATDIKDVLKKSSPWSTAKKIGKSFIPPGDATQAFNRLQQQFKKVGLIIPEVGEAEGFYRNVGDHGPKWVNEVLTKDLKTDPELEAARRFVLQLVD